MFSYCIVQLSFGETTLELAPFTEPKERNQQQSKSNQTNQGGSQGIEKDRLPRTQTCKLVLCGVIRQLVCEVQYTRGVVLTLAW